TCTNVSGNTVTGSTAPTGFLPTTVAIAQVSFGVVITNATNHPGAPIRIANTSGALVGQVFFPGGADPVNRSGGTVTVQIGTANTGTSWATGQTGSFDLLGVLVSLNGSGKTSVDAALFIGGGTSYQVVSPS